ncbi:MAG TPA: hypothetical protein VIG99_06775 [Myxococcaceae bacterium]|jgi:hypothetical protein
MAGGPQRSLNLDELMAKIRAEVGARAQAPSPAAPPPAPQAPVALSGARARIQQFLETAARYAPLSSLQAELASWGPVKKSVALPVTRVVAYLSRFITSKQALFNQAVLDAVRELDALAGAGGVAPEAVESLRIQVRRLMIEVRSLQMGSAPPAGATEASSPAQVAVAARLESLSSRMAALEEQVARLVPEAAERPRRARTEP